MTIKEVYRTAIREWRDKYERHGLSFRFVCYLWSIANNKPLDHETCQSLWQELVVNSKGQSRPYGFFCHFTGINILGEFGGGLEFPNSYVGWAYGNYDTWEGKFSRGIGIWTSRFQPDEKRIIELILERSNKQSRRKQ